MHGGRELVFQEPETVDEDQVKGRTSDAAGRVRRQVAEWTGYKEAQIEGWAQENARDEQGTGGSQLPRGGKARR